MLGWGTSSRLDRIEATLEQLVEISIATNRRIDRFVESTQEQLQVHQQELASWQQRTEQMQQRTEQMQRAIEYLLSKDN